MNILFVVENMAQKCGANVNIAINLAKQMAKENSISALTKTNTQRPVSSEKTESFDRCESFFSNESEYLAAFQTKHSWNKIGALKKMLLMLTHPRVPIYMTDTKYFDSYFTRRRYVKQLKRICKDGSFDAVVCVCAPYYLARALSKVKTSAKKVIFQLDPYSYNYTMSARFINRRRRIEKNVIEKMDKVFCASFVYDDIKKNSITEQKDKLVGFMLPGIIVGDGVNTEISCVEQKTMVDFVFVGQFYDGIRSPEFLLKLFENLPSNYILHIFGGGADKTLEKYKALLGDRLVLHGWVSAEEAKAQMYRADVLVNVNNSILNQMASKMFEYIGTGKPFLNICKMQECPSLVYSKKYSLCMNLIESEGDNAVQKTVDFVERAKGKTISREEVLALFGECTDEYVASLICRHLTDIGK